ncbi:MAG: hypothetical protein WC560_07560, partial [Syntrophales bacterium]
MIIPIGKYSGGFLKGTRKEMIVCLEEMEPALWEEDSREREEAQGQEEEWERVEAGVEGQALEVSVSVPPVVLLPSIRQV